MDLFLKDFCSSEIVHLTFSHEAKLSKAYPKENPFNSYHGYITFRNLTLLPFSSKEMVAVFYDGERLIFFIKDRSFDFSHPGLHVKRNCGNFGKCNFQVLIGDREIISMEYWDNELNEFGDDIFRYIERIMHDEDFRNLLIKLYTASSQGQSELDQFINETYRETFIPELTKKHNSKFQNKYMYKIFMYYFLERMLLLITLLMFFMILYFIFVFSV